MVNYKEIVKAIFHETCKYSDKYGHPNDAKFFDEWQSCDSCILRNVQYLVEHGLGKITRDLCFAIWHEGILEKSKKFKY